MHTLYPPIKPYKWQNVAVSGSHELYLEETGNPNGLPVIVLHSGPGVGADAYLRRFFDPQLYRIILFDQRGCGRSMPHMELNNNTTNDLLADIGHVSNLLNLSYFVLFGVGWGTLLALLYAQNYPQHVAALLLQQIFLGRKKDIDWLFKGGINRVFPDYWEEFANFVPIKERQDILGYYAKCLKGKNDLARMAAAKNWAVWQARCSSLHPHLSLIEQYSDPHFALTLATFESFYMCNHFFIEENQILANAKKIVHIPAYLIHGRYDMICPLEGAWELAQTLPLSHLSIVREGGHSDQEAGIIDALITASNKIARQGLDVC